MIYTVSILQWETIIRFINENPFRFKMEGKSIGAIANRLGSEPSIHLDANYVIIGAEHALELPWDSAKKLVDSLEGIVALKMECSDEELRRSHPMSTEMLAKVSVGSAPVSYFPEPGGEKFGQIFQGYNVPEELAEVFVPFMHYKNVIAIGREVPDGFFGSVPEQLQEYKELRFGFIDVSRGIENFTRVAEYWYMHNLDPLDLVHFAYDFEKFMGDVREYELWLPDLQEFRSQYAGRIAICCGNYHVPFIRMVLEGVEPLKPDWKTHIETRREDTDSVQDADKLKAIYEHIEAASGQVASISF